MEEEYDNGAIYGYVFHYNHHRKMWFAIPRDEYIDYWSGTSANCISHSDHGELLKIIFEDYYEEKE